MGASFPLLPKFTLSPISVFPSVIVQILTPVNSNLPGWNVCLYPSVHLSP